MIGPTKFELNPISIIFFANPPIKVQQMAGIQQSGTKDTQAA